MSPAGQFTFELEPVLLQRRARRDHAERALAQARQRAAAEERSLQAAQDGWRQSTGRLQQVRRSFSCQHGGDDVSPWEQARRVAALRATVAEDAERVARHRDVLAARTHQVALHGRRVREAIGAVQEMERLRERHERAFRCRQEASEEARRDDDAVLRWRPAATRRGGDR